MTLHLSNEDIEKLEHANTVLLSPFAFEDCAAWRRAAARAVENVLGGDGSSYVLPMAGEQMVAASAEIERALEALLPLPDWMLSGLTVRRRALDLRVTDWAELFDASVVKRSAFYNEVVRPHGLLAPLVMATETGAGDLPSALSVYFSDERSARSHANRRKELMRLLYPAYCGGLKAYLALRRNSAALRALAEDAAIGVALFDRRGRLGRENTFLRQLMCSEPERDRVRGEVTRVVHAALSAAILRSSTSGARRANSEVRTIAARYRIAATFVDEEWSQDATSVIALVDRVEGKSCGARELAARFSLTQRETETALLLRSGLSSRQIAADLGISVNTARRHVESVLLKLDVHTRTAAAARLAGN
jgi:DNA-binding CsgD family transcriptional regulator